MNLSIRWREGILLVAWSLCGCTSAAERGVPPAQDSGIASADGAVVGRDVVASEDGHGQASGLPGDAVDAKGAPALSDTKDDGADGDCGRHDCLDGRAIVDALSGAASGRSDSVDTLSDTLGGSKDVDVISISPDVPSPDTADGTVDSQDAGGEPSPCGTCEPDEEACINDKLGWYCTDAPIDGQPWPCWHVTYQPCDEGKCSTGKGECICTPTGGTVCSMWSMGAHDVHEETDCTKQPGAMLEDCEYPGCYAGACLDTHPKSTQLWPRPEATLLLRVLPLGPGHMITGGYENALFEYENGGWRDRRIMSDDMIHVGLFEEPDGTIYTIADGFRRWVRTGEETWDVTHYSYTELQYLCENIPFDVWALDKDNYYLALGNGVSAHCKDGKCTWILVNYGPQGLYHMLGVWARSADDVWTVGQKGLARHFDGTAWKPVPGLSVELGAPEVDLTAVRGTPDGDVFVIRGPTVLKRAGSDWKPIFVAPEPDVAHRLWVGAADDIWVWGQVVASHYDGVGWTSYSLGYPETKALLADVACYSKDDCWAVGGEGLVLHFDGDTWTQVSEGQGELSIGGGKYAIISGNATTAVWAASPDIVFTAVSSQVDDFLLNEYGPDKAWVRRHILKDNVVVDEKTWPVGGYSDWIPGWNLRGLWGTSAKNVFVASDKPRQFDGEQWTPLDLPPELAAKTEAVTLTGRGNDLYVSLRQPDPLPPGTYMAHRKASGGPWTVFKTTAVYFDLWVADDGYLYGLRSSRIVRFMPDGTEDLVLKLYSAASPPDEYFAVSHEGEVLYTNSDKYSIYHELLTSDGQANHFVKPYSDGYTPAGVAVPPSGPGFFVADQSQFFELGTSNTAPLTKPVHVDSYKPWGFAGLYTTSMFAAPWGDVYIGQTQGKLAHMAAPWKLKGVDGVPTTP